MKTLLFIATASSLLAQSDPRVQRLVDQWMSRRGGFTATPQKTPTVKTLAGVVPQEPPNPCSVPLIEMKIPSDVQFTMQHITPPSVPIDNIQTNVPAPSCR
jgi:hypothetical protein